VNKKKGGEGRCHLQEVGLVLAEAGVEVLAEVGLVGEEAAAWVLAEAGGEVLAEAGSAVGTGCRMEDMACRSPMVVTHAMDMAYRSPTAVTRGKR
jgi:hypothetical protein